MPPMNCYDILGIGKGASPSEIRKAYRMLASHYHPDKVRELPERLRAFAEEEMRRINTAKDTLLDEKRKREHDTEILRTRSRGPSPAPSPTRQKRSIPNTFVCPHCSARISAIPIDRPYVLSCPSCMKQMTIPAVTNGSDTHANGNGGSDRLRVYGEALRRALMDGVITMDESYILDGLREVLAISPMEHQDMLFRLQRRNP